MHSTITSKGQLTLPKKIREYLGISTGDRVRFEVTETGKVELSPIKTTLMDLKGMLRPPKKKVTIAEMKKAIEEEAGKI